MTVAVSAEAVSDRTDEIVSDHATLEGPLMPILHAIQAEFGFVPQEALPRIADKLNISRT